MEGIPSYREIVSFVLSAKMAGRPKDLYSFGLMAVKLIVEIHIQMYFMPTLKIEC